MASDTERLAKLEAAIDGYIAAGCVSSYTYEGVTVTRESLEAMEAARDRLRASVNAASGSKRSYTVARRGCR